MTATKDFQFANTRRRAKRSRSGKSPPRRRANPELGVTARMREFEKGIGGALLADGGHAAMPGIHNRLIGQDHQLLMNRAQNLLERAAPKVGAADASGEKRVSGEEPGGIAGEH